ISPHQRSCKEVRHYPVMIKRFIRSYNLQGLDRWIFTCCWIKQRREGICMDTNQYIEMFLDESREHLQYVNDNLLKLEKHPQDLSIISEIIRSDNILKSIDATMKFKDIYSLINQIEKVKDKIRHKELDISKEVIDISYKAIEYLEEMVQVISEG